MAITKQDIFDHRGGVNRNARANNGQAFQILNMRPLSDGSLEVVKGRSVEVSGIGAGGSIQAVLGRQTVAAGEEVYSIKREDGVNDKTYVSSSEITGADFGAGSHTSIMSYGSTVFFTNGETDINYHVPGSGVRAVVTGTELPKGQVGFIYKDRMYIFTSSGQVAWSNAGIFSALPAIDIDANARTALGSEDDPIIGAAAGQNVIVAISSGKYYLMTGEPGDSGDFHTMTWNTYQGVGTRSPKSVLSTRRGVAFYGSDQHIYRIQGSNLIDLDPDNRVREFLEAPGTSVFGSVATAAVGEEIYFYLPKANDPADGRVLVYNEVFKCWYVFEHFGGFAMHFLDKTRKLLIGDSNGNTVWSQFSSDLDLGSKLSTELISRQFVFGSFDTKKSFRNLRTHFKAIGGEVFSLSYEKNDSRIFTAFETNGTITVGLKAWGAETWGASAWSDDSVVRTKSEFGTLVSPEAREMRVKISGALPAGSKILDYTVYAEPLLRDD